MGYVLRMKFLYLAYLIVTYFCVCSHFRFHLRGRVTITCEWNKVTLYLSILSLWEFPFVMVRTA